MHWIIENAGSLIAGAVVAGIVTLAVIGTVRRHKKGGCSCGCDGCANAGNCNKAGKKPPAL